MIGQHSKLDNLVLLFGKILRNEVEEEFYSEQQKTIKTVKRLLESYLRTKHPLMANADIKKKLEKISQGLISKSQAIDMVKYLYAGKDIKAVELLMDHLFAEQVHSVADTSKPKVQFKFFEKVILDYQLSAHEDKLHNFKELFSGFDKERKGMLEGEPVIKLLEQIRLRKCQFEIISAKNKLDPIASGKVTYSQFVEVLHNIFSEGTSLSVIQKLGKLSLIKRSHNY